MNFQLPCLPRSEQKNPVSPRIREAFHEFHTACWTGIRHQVVAKSAVVYAGVGLTRGSRLTKITNMFLLIFGRIDAAKKFRADDYCD